MEQSSVMEVCPINLYILNFIFALQAHSLQHFLCTVCGKVIYLTCGVEQKVDVMMAFSDPVSAIAREDLKPLGLNGI